MPMRDYSLPNSRPDTEVALTERQLLQSVVECALYVFSAAASSVFLVDAQTSELIFEAVAGEGAGHLPGTRFPPGTGIVGWVATSTESMFVDDLAHSSLFDVEAAESTGYVPRNLMAAPLIVAGDCIGVIEVLDRGSAGRGPLTDLDLLGLLGTQAAISLDLLVRARRQAPPARLARDASALLGRIGRGLQNADADAAAVVLRLLATVDELLAVHEPGATARGGRR